MDWSPRDGRDGPLQLARLAEQFEQLAPYLSRADTRIRIMERAAECRAEAALIHAARRRPANVRAF